MCTFRKAPWFLLTLIVMAALLGGSAFAAEVVTDSTVYNVGSSVGIDGFTFGSNETITLQVTELDGTPIAGDAGLPWTVPSDGSGDFGTEWLLDYLGTSDQLMVTAVGGSSGLIATTSFLAGATNLDQLQNGAGSSPPAWTNGNINVNNSCYSEGRAVPYRAFIIADTGAPHYFTIEMEWSKASIHAFDFLATYNFSEDSAITLAGGPCGDSGTSAPGDCIDPSYSMELPNPIDSFNYSGSIPADFYTLVNDTFQYNGPHYLMAYNVDSVWVEPYQFGGSSTDRTWSVVVHYIQSDTGTVGFYWGGHLAQGNPDHWGYGNGSASVSGAPYHMRMLSFDGGGGAGQDKSVQGATICLPPAPSIVIDADSLCYDRDTTYIAYDTSDANDWLWHVTGGTIIGDSTLSWVEFSVDGAGDVTIELMACNADGGCPGDYCCDDMSLTLPTKACNTPPEVTCPGADTVFQCDLTQICVSGFTSYDPDGDALTCSVSPGTLDGDSVCFTPVEGDNVITYICSDGILADTCETTIHVVLNQPPSDPTCPTGYDLLLCDLADSVCVDGFGCNGDPDGNLAYSYAVGGVLNGSTVCFLPVEGANTITYVCVDSCGDSSYCQTTINVTLDTTGPTVNCPGDTSLVLCDLTEVCIDGFSSSADAVSCSVDVGTLTDGTVCFTPVEGANTITYTCVDSCGNESSCQTVVTVTLDNTGPTVSCPDDVTLTLCDLVEVCVDGFSSSADAVSCSVDVGTLTGSQVCFTPVEGQNTITYTCVDSCGNESSCQTNVFVILDTDGLTVSCPSDTSLVLCELGEICIDGFSSGSDAVSCSVDVGTLTDGTVCFTPVEGLNTITYTCVDSCGNQASCQTNVNVTLDNTGPTVSCPDDISLVRCDLSEICIDGFTSGADAVSCSVDLGTLTGSEVCFTPVEGANVITYTCVDSCGNATSCQTTVTVTLDTEGPTVSCPDDVSLVRCDLSDICIDGFTSSADAVDCSVDLGTLTGSEVCFTPVEGVNTITYTCVDSCGNASSCQTTVTVTLDTEGPTVSCPDDISLVRCDLGDICIDGFTSDADAVSCSVDLGTLTGSEVCFTPVEGANVITYTCVDSCGNPSSCQTTVTVILDTEGPTVSCPDDVSLVRCNLTDEVCIDGFTSDADAVSCSVDLGTLTGSEVCFTPVEGANVITYTCVDSCGNASSCQTTVTVTLDTEGPPMTCPDDVSMFVCELDEICIAGFSSTGAESCSASPGVLSNGTVCFTPHEGANTITYTCADSCGNESSCQTVVTVTVNDPPQVSCPSDSSILTCFVDDSVCIGPFDATDSDGNLKLVTLNGMPYTPGTIYCFVPDSGMNALILTATDSCDATAACTTYVDVEQDTPENCAECPIVKIEKTHNTHQGQHEFVDVTIDSAYNLYRGGMGGYDFLIAWDASALIAQSVIPGPPFYDPAPDGCGWEYFVYRFGPCGWCADQCPTGMARVFGLAETNNGFYHPACFSPDPEPATLFTFDFLVTDDRTLECQYIPIYFFWCDCGDNTVSDSTGNHLYMDELIYDLEGNVVWDENDDVNYPESARIPWIGGAPDSCIVSEPGKPGPVRCLDFWNGGIDIVCADSIDARGDINLNGTSNEIADAVVFSNYFTLGLPVFTVNLDGQIAATDVNADGITLSVADLVYLIRVIVGDANPYVKQAPLAVEADLSNGVLSIGTPLGAAWVVMDGEQQPRLLAGQMEMKYHYDAASDQTRILVYSMTKGSAFEGDFLAGLEGQVVTFEAATYDGVPVTARLVPDQFELYQSYPNPFNPMTTISFSLAQAADYRLTIYNTLGREVQTFTGHGQPGVVEIQWNAAGHASGIYFYRLTAGDFTATKKMVLLK